MSSLSIPRSAKANGIDPISCLGRVFVYKLGCFDDMRVVIYMDARPHLELKTQPRFSPVSQNLSVPNLSCPLAIFSGM
jgi:hypothetical protein